MIAVQITLCSLGMAIGVTAKHETPSEKPQNAANNIFMEICDLFEKCIHDSVSYLSALANNSYHVTHASVSSRGKHAAASWIVPIKTKLIPNIY